MSLKLIIADLIEALARVGSEPPFDPDFVPAKWQAFEDGHYDEEEEADESV